MRRARLGADPGGRVDLRRAGPSSRTRSTRARSGGGLYAGPQRRRRSPSRDVRRPGTSTRPRTPRSRAIGSGAPPTSTPIRRYETPIYTMNRKLTSTTGRTSSSSARPTGARDSARRRPLRRREPRGRREPRRRPRRVAQRVLRRRRPGLACQADAGSEPDTSSFRMYRGAFVLQDDSDPVFTSPPAGSLTAPRHAARARTACRSRPPTPAAGCTRRSSRSTARTVGVAVARLQRAVHGHGALQADGQRDGVARHGRAGGRPALRPRPPPGRDADPTRPRSARSRSRRRMRRRRARRPSRRR